MLFTNRLKSNKGFVRAFKKGVYAANDAVVVYFVRNKTPYNNLGISVSKKIGNAVLRNRAKRIIRAAYRECEADIPIGYDMVFAAKPNINGKKSGDIAGFIKRRVIPAINKKALSK